MNDSTRSRVAAVAVVLGEFRPRWYPGARMNTGQSDSSSQEDSQKQYSDCQASNDDGAGSPNTMPRKPMPPHGRVTLAYVCFQPADHDEQHQERGCWSPKGLGAVER